MKFDRTDSSPVGSGYENLDPFHLWCAVRVIASAAADVTNKPAGAAAAHAFIITICSLAAERTNILQTVYKRLANNLISYR